MAAYKQTQGKSLADRDVDDTSPLRSTRSSACLSPVTLVYFLSLIDNTTAKITDLSLQFVPRSWILDEVIERVEKKSVSAAMCPSTSLRCSVVVVLKAMVESM